jgi:hypothetical protein
MTGAAVLVLSLLAPVAAASEARTAWEKGVVALEVTYQEWDEDQPWAKRRPGSRSAMAVVVDAGGPRLLTSAQMVAGATLVRAEKHGRATRTTARLDRVDRAVDLALLAVDDPAFFADLKPVVLAEASPTSGVLRTARWRNQQLEAATSRIKRYEVGVGYYGTAGRPFLLLQTDLSGGGWGEPVFAADGLVGITESQDELSARAIPVETVAPFLDRAREPGSTTGPPDLGFTWQVNEEPALARYLGQSGEPRGVLIAAVPWGSTGCGVLRPRDILLEIDGQAIDASGYFRHPRLGRLGIGAILAGRRVGEQVPARLLRQGEEMQVTLELREYPVALDLVPERRGPEPPPYLIAGGLVLRELDGDFLRSWGTEWWRKAPLDLVVLRHRERSRQAPGRRRVLLLLSVLPGPYTVGYQDLRDQVVRRINGQDVDSVRAAVAALARPQGDYQVVELEPSGERDRIVLDAAGFDQATATALEEYGMPAPVRLEQEPLPDPGPPCP